VLHRWHEHHLNSLLLLMMMMLLLLACRRFWQQLLGGLTVLDLAVLCFIAGMNASWMSGILMANMKKVAAKTAQHGLAKPTVVSNSLISQCITATVAVLRRTAAMSLGVHMLSTCNCSEALGHNVTGSATALVSVYMVLSVASAMKAVMKKVSTWLHSRFYRSNSCYSSSSSSSSSGSSWVSIMPSCTLCVTTALVLQMTLHMPT
jgi:hypothetical protein